MNNYKKDEMLKKLENDLDYHLCCLEAWEKVKRNRKKDGADFAIISKNFENAKYDCASYSDMNHPEISVFFRTNKTGYREDSLICYIYMDQLQKDDPRREENTTQENGFTRKTILFSPDEIMERIEKRKEYHKNKIKELKKQIKNLDSVFLYCDKEFYNMMEKINKKAGLETRHLLQDYFSGIMYQICLEKFENPYKNKKGEK